LIDLTNKVFGDLTVLRYEGNSKWICVCSCTPEKEISIHSSSLRRGLKTHCGCKRQYRTRDEIEFPAEYNNKFKICSECGEEKEYKEFYFKEGINPEGNKSYYFNASCIKCDKLSAIKWANENIEIKRESCRKNSKTEKTREVLRKNGKKQRESGWRQKWEAENPDKINKYQKNRRHKNHKINKKEWEACKKYFDYQCAYCGFPIEDHYRIYAGKLQKIDLHKEHVDHEGSSDLSNCVPSCKTCNDFKHQFELDEWYNKDNINYTKERYDKIIKWITEDYIYYIDHKNKKS